MWDWSSAHHVPRCPLGGPCSRGSEGKREVYRKKGLDPFCLLHLVASPQPSFFNSARYSSRWQQLISVWDFLHTSRIYLITPLLIAKNQPASPPPQVWLNPQLHRPLTWPWTSSLEVGAPAEPHPSGERSESLFCMAAPARYNKPNLFPFFLQYCCLKLLPL